MKNKIVYKWDFKNHTYNKVYVDDKVVLMTELDKEVPCVSYQDMCPFPATFHNIAVRN